MTRAQCVTRPASCWEDRLTRQRSALRTTSEKQRDTSYRLKNFVTSILFYSDSLHAVKSFVMSDSLHWLSFPQRVTFKLSLMTYKCLHARTCPVYLLLPSQNVHVYNLPTTGCCTFREHKTITLGPRAFSSSGPSFWNSLTPVLRDPDISLLHFRQLLKTYLFNTD